MKRTFLAACFLLLAACRPAGAALPPTVASIPGTATPTEFPSATPEPTATFTPLPPTPLPRFFTENFNGALPGWAILQSNQTSAPRTRAEGGMLIFDLNAPYQWVYAIFGAEEYADARVDGLVQSRGTGPEALGLICRYSEANGWYEFNVSSDGTYSVLFGRWLAEGVADYAPIAADRSPYVQRGSAQNEIGLSCRGDTLSLYINGKLFRNLDVSRFGLTAGRLGLSAASFENVPVTAVFDWIKVSKP